MAQLNTNIQRTWDGLQGSDVQNAIKQQFQSNIDSINNSVTGISFEKGVEGSVKYTVTKNDGSTVSSIFALVQPSEIKAQLDSLTIPEYVTPGENAAIRYSFSIWDGDTQTSGKRATVTIKIENGNYSKTLSFRTNTSYKNSSRAESYTIDGQWIKEGINQVTVSIGYTDIDGSSSQGMYADGVEWENIQMLSFNLKVSSTLSGVSINEKIDITKQFSIPLTFSTETGKSIYSYGLSGKITTILYNSNLVSVKSTVTNALPGITLNSLSSTAPANNTYVFYIQSKITFPNKTIYSNVIKYSLVSSIDNGNITRYAYTLQDYNNYTNGDIKTSGNYITGTQYSNVNLSIYALTASDKVFTYKLNDEIVTTLSNIKGDSTKLQLIVDEDSQLTNTPWSCQLTNPTLNTIVVSDGTQSLTFQVNTKNIGGTISVPSNAVTNLSANGKIGKDETWGVNSNNESLTTFTGFDWSSNGWLKDKNGKSALVVNNNARAVINIAPCYKTISTSNTSTTSTGRTVSIRFKTSNENTDEPLISCVSANRDGFEIYPQKAIIRRGSQYTETEFSSEDSTKEITFVWYNTEYGDSSIIYINGTSQAVLLKGTSTSNGSKITINSNDTSTYIYNVDIYEKALNFSEVQSLYCLHNESDISKYAVENAIFNQDITIGNNSDKVSINSLPVGSKYLLVKAHPKGCSRFWEAINNLEATKEIIEDGKTKTKETKSWRLLVGNCYLITKKENDSEGDTFNFFADKATFSGQGTSSMRYPIKNYRLYFGKGITNPNDTGNQEGFGDCYSGTIDGTVYEEGDYGKTSIFVQGSSVNNTSYSTDTSDAQKVYKMRENSIPANVFCLKADYAESSGVHNTGFARLANDVMENSGNISSIAESTKLPVNSVSESSHDNVSRSTIDGFQVYLFFEDLEGNQVYAGKYNFNNEKASPEVFGFQPYNEKLKCVSYIKYKKDETANKPKPSTYQNYFDNSIVKNEANVLKRLFNITDESYEKGHMVYTASNSSVYVNPTECWEFSSNDSDNVEHKGQLDSIKRIIGAFTFPYTAENGRSLSGYPYSNNPSYSNLNPFTERVFKEDTISNDLAWINTEQAWEPRFPDDDDINDFYEGGGTPYLLRSVYKWVHKHNVYCWPDSLKAEHASEFAQNLHKYFNVNFLIKYYVLTKLCINADQRIKNCMLAFYCDPNVELNEDSETPTGHMRGFYIFYDNDTILGVSNTGNLTNKWNAGEDFGVFQGIDENNKSFHGLWGNIEYCYDAYINGTYQDDAVYNLGKMVDSAYKAIRNVATDTIIKEYLNSSLPDAASNIDAEVKYFYPEALSPKSTNWDSENIQKYQGDRKYHREWFLSRRTKWFDAIFGGTSINDYKISFKLEAASGSYVSKNIKITSAFDKWRFYKVHKTDMESTNLLNKNQIGILSFSDTTVNSDPYEIQGLYGASKIDFSDWYGMTDTNNFLNSIFVGKDLPYLTEFIIGHEKTEGINTNFYVSKDQLDKLFANTPNLSTLTIQNVKTSDSSSFSLSLAQLTKLRTLNTIDTLCDIVLPKGSYLQTLVINAPTSLTFEDKLNLSSFTIQDDQNINKLIVKHSNNYLYQWALNYYKNHYTTFEQKGLDNEGNEVFVNEPFTIVFGNGSDKDTLSKETIELLIEIANLIKINNLENISISGLGYYKDLTTTQSNALYNVFGANLVISKTNTDKFELQLNNGNLLEENGTLNVDPTLKIDDNTQYSIILVSGDSVAYNKVSVSDESSPYLCILKASPINDNERHQCVIKVEATSSGVTKQSSEIIVQYNPISSLTLSTDNQVGTGEKSINININVGSTKQHLLTPDNWNLTATAGTAQWILQDGSITGINYTYTKDTDGQVTVKSKTNENLEATINMYYDVKVCDSTDMETKAELIWLGDLFKNNISLLEQSNRIMRSDLAKISMQSTSGTIVITAAGKTAQVAANENNVYDLTALQYFKAPIEFTIPTNFKFSNLSLPEGVVSVNWTSVYPQYSEYETIVFPNTVSKVRIALSLEVSLPKLTFDISNCSKITKIYNASESVANRLADGVFSLNLNANNSSCASPNHELFKYRANTITQVGNYSSTNGNSAVDPSNAMFNISELNYNNNASPLYNLGSPVNGNGLYIGFISSYFMDSSAFNWAGILAYIKGLYYTFYKGSGLTGLQSLSFVNLEEIGDCVFYSIPRDLTPEVLELGSKVKKINYGAFNLYKGTITSVGNELDLSSVTSLGSYAFYELTVSHEFILQNLTSIGERVFKVGSVQKEGLDEYEDKPHTIILNAENTLPSSGLPSQSNYPFGNRKLNTLIIPVNAVRNQLDSLYGNDVNIVAQL